MRRLALGLLTATTLIGCVPEDEDIVAFDERFEDECLACRWTMWFGTPELVSTVHPAEHGLQFNGATGMQVPLAIEMYDEFNDGHWIEYSTDCGGTPQLSVSNVAIGEWTMVLQIPSQPDGSPDEFERVYTNLPPIIDPDPYDYDGPRLTSLQLFADPWTGPCVIDNLRVMLSAPDDGW